MLSGVKFLVHFTHKAPSLSLSLSLSVENSKEEENAKAISLFADVVLLNDAIEDGGKRVENLVRGIFAGNIFDLGSAQVSSLLSESSTILDLIILYLRDMYKLVKFSTKPDLKYQLVGFWGMNRLICYVYLFRVTYKIN